MQKTRSSKKLYFIDIQGHKTLKIHDIRKVHLLIPYSMRGFSIIFSIQLDTPKTHKISTHRHKKVTKFHKNQIC